MVAWGQTKWKVLAGCSGVLAVLCIAIAIVIPSIVTSQVSQKVKDTITLRPDNVNTWAQIPGSNNISLYKRLFVFNVENPMEIQMGGKARVKQMGPYFYKTTKDLLDLKFEGNQVTFTPYERYEFVPSLSAGTEQDVFTNINLAPYNVFYQAQQQTIPALASGALYSIQTVLYETLMPSYYAQFFKNMPSFMDYDSFKQWATDTIGLTQSELDWVWTSDIYGFQKWQNLVPWMEALIQGQDSQVYKDIATYFRPISKIGDMYENMNGLRSFIVDPPTSQTYNCTSQTACTVDEIALGQWGRALITLNPADPSVPAAPSLYYSDPNMPGFPEFAAFSSLVTKHNLTFDLTTSKRLLNTFSLFSNVTELLDMVARKDWAATTATYGLDQTYATEFRDYLLYLAQNFALRNANTEILITAKFASGVVPEVVSKMSSLLPAVTYARGFYHGKVADKTVALQILQDAGFSSALAGAFAANTRVGFGAWSACLPLVQAALKGSSSQEWATVAGLYKLNATLMTSLLGPTSALMQSVGALNSAMAQQYGCRNTAFCRPDELYRLQFRANGVVGNPPAGFNIPAFPSLRDSLTGFMPIGYFEFASWANVTRQPIQQLTAEQTSKLLSSDCLPNMLYVQKFLIQANKGQWANITAELGVPEAVAKSLVKYLGAQVDQFAFKGMFQTKTVKEVMWGYTDPLLVDLSTRDPKDGGDPSIDPLIQLGDNCTSAAEARSEPASVYTTGTQDYNSVRQYTTYKGSKILTYQKKVFDGHQVVTKTIQPWATEKPVLGGDGIQFKVGLSREDKVPVLVEEVLRVGNLAYQKDVDIKGINTYRFVLSPENLMNADNYKPNADYYMFGPNGMANLTALKGAPIWVSKPHFLDVDPAVRQLVDGVNPDPEVHETILDIEPNSGAPLNVHKQLQVALQMLPSLVYPNLNKNMYLPLFYIDQTSTLSDDKLDEIKSGLTMARNVTLLARWVGSILGGIFAILALLLAYSIVRHHKHESDYHAMPGSDPQSDYVRIA